jgi:ABC-2 type transport system permease protein
MVVLVAILGRLVYGVSLPTQTIPAVLVTLAVGAFAFSCLGFALTAVIPSEDAAPAVTNAIMLPLYFVSGVFIPDSEIPSGVLHVADVFPVRHFFEAFFTAWDPNTTGAGIEFGDLAVVAAWGLFGLLVAVRFFRWEPRR